MLEGQRDIVLVDPVRCVRDEHYMRIRLGTDVSGTSVAIRDPLGLEYIASYLEKQGYRTKVIIQGELSDDQLVTTILGYEPKFVGFSLWTYNVPRICGIANEIKTRNNNVKIVVGGYHPTGDPNIVREKGIDFAVLGEGEETFLDLVRRVQDGRNVRNVKGLAFHDGEKVIINPLRERLVFKSLPWPKREKEIMAISRISGLTYPPPSRQIAAVQVQYTRGCPYNCYFCPSGSLWRTIVSYRVASDVVTEISYLNSTFGTNYVYFADLTFNLVEKKVRELCEEMIERQPKVCWNAMLRVGTKPSLFDLMKEAGCSRVALGAELLEDSSLRMVKPRQNMEMIEKDFAYADSIGLITRCFLLMGFPFEKKTYYQTLLENLKTLAVDNVRLGFVVPFPGTSYYAEWKQHLAEKNLERFTGEYPIFTPDNLSLEELPEIRATLVRSFYTSKEYVDRVRRKVERFPALEESFRYFFGHQLIPSGLAKVSPV